MLKRLLCCMLALLCLLGCASAEETHPDGFLFMDAIDWNTTADEAAEMLGEGVQRMVDPGSEIGSAEALFVQNVQVAGYPAPTLLLVYYEDRLYAIECYFKQEDVPDVQALADALSAFLGEAEIYAEDRYTLADIMSGNKTLYAWNPGDLTEATLAQMNDGQEFGLQIVNSSVADALEQAYRDAGYMDD